MFMMDSVESYMRLVVLVIVLLSFLGQYIVNRFHQPYAEETEDGYIVYMYQASKRGGRYHDYTFTEKDGGLVYKPKMSRLLLYVGGMIFATAMVYHSFHMEGKTPGEMVHILLLFGVMMLGTAASGPIMAYAFLRRDD